MAGSFLFCLQETNVNNYVLKYTAPPPEIKVLFLGDLMFDRGIRQFAKKNGNSFIFEKIHDFLADQDLVIANLEGPITDNSSISVNSAVGSTNNYLFTFPASLAETLFDENIKVVNLGNNHILNFGQAGLASTKKYLDQAGVDYFGAPDSPKSTLKEIKGVKTTFISYNEFSGFGKVEIKSAVEEIKKSKEYSDIIIVFCHWGAEYQKDDPAMQSSARSFIDSGADLVVGSHPHIILPSEIYNGKRIYYSLGNFVFDQYFSEETRQGLGVVLKINPKTKEFGFEEKRLYIKSNGQTVLAE